jgi:hypothetical protein
MEHAPALEVLGRMLGLSDFEKQVLLLCAAPELDPSFSALLAQAQADPAQSFPTFVVALATLDSPAWDVLSPDRPLRYWRLIEINQPPTQPLIGSALRVDEQIVNYLRGLNYLDDRLAAYVSRLHARGEELPATQRAAADEVVKGWTEAQERIPVIQLVGADGASKQLVATHAAAQIGRRLYQLQATTLPQQAAELDSLARLWQRESMLQPFALYIDAQDPDQNNSGSHSAVQKFLSRCEGFLVIAVREAIPALARQGWTVEVSRPAAAEQRELWRKDLAGVPESAPAELSAQFNLNATDILRVARMAAAREDGIETVAERAWRLCRELVRPQLDCLARRIEVKAGWDDIVLPAQEAAMLRQIAAQVSHRNRVYELWGYARKMNRGLGISALFCGESGTGKTMAAEVIANELRLNLYRIDLSAVVSKYIGETEKNLCRLFDAAEDGGAILFFDEADALFGKRSEVKDSHDRYANIEINYLLQRIEAYRGLAILATNMRSALDAAFIRRLRFVLNFPFPTVADRRRMWEKAFPAETPVRGLNYDRLARLNLTGGSIHNAALNAAFMAAHADSAVDTQMVLSSARNEFIKMERPINEADFRLLEAAEAVV